MSATMPPGLTSPPEAPPPVDGEPVCPCEQFVHPRIIANPAGLAAISYRAGDFLSFRHALLLSQPNETELTNPSGPVWRPAPGDLSLQLVEWWAYIADVLTFYNQRIANQAYLRTADQLDSLQRLIRLLGYRPRPGIGAQGVLAAVTSGTASFTLPAGFAITSKPGLGKQPQTFELDADTLVQAPGVVAADPPSTGALVSDDGVSVLLTGRVPSLKQGDELMLLRRATPAQAAAGSLPNQLATVQAVAAETDTRGRPLTRVTFASAITLADPAGTAQAADYRLLKSAQAPRIWPYDTGSKVLAVSAGSADLSQVARNIGIGDPVLFEVAPGVAETVQIETTLVSVTAYTEAVWYVVADPDDPTMPKPSQPASFIPVGLLHSSISFTPSLSGDPALWNQYKSSVTVRYDWRDVGQLVAAPATALAVTSGSLAAASGANFPVGKQGVLVQGADGTGAAATATVLAGAPGTVQLTGLPDPALTLAAPLTVLTNLLPVSRGKTVTSEVLGSGDATIAGQQFVLQNAPLTYLQSKDSTSDANYRSTLQLWVGGIAWAEVPSFYGQDAQAQVFVTREDETNQTHVLFGDGVLGARLPTGVNNVVVSYRYGSGAAVPDPGTLTVLAQPWPGLRAVLNPVAVGGGSDPDPPSKIRQDAPLSVLTFGRAISADDYGAIAGGAPGVARARAYFAFDGDTQRAAVTIYVGDTPAARDAAALAVSAAIDSNRPALVKLATAVPLRLSATIRIDPRQQFQPVLDAVRAALIDPDTGLFGAARAGIGVSVYDSEIYAACLVVPGVRAVRELSVSSGPKFVPLVRQVGAVFPLLPVVGPIRLAAVAPGGDASLCASPEGRQDPPAGGFFTLADADLNLSPAADDGARPDG